MKTVALISKPEKPELHTVAPKLVEWLTARGYSVLADSDTAVYVPGVNKVERSEIAANKPDFVIVLGGDGTLLAAARSVARAEIPILGVNLGSLGFLTEVSLDELYKTLEAVERHDVAHEARSMLECRLVRDGKTVAEYIALNDIVITKGAIARLTEVDVTVDGRFVANYKADGVIVATPTGSTAYSLAAGGPVLEPTVDAFIITPVSPHALTNRPLVVRDSAEIAVIVRSTPDEAFITVDGQRGEQVFQGDQVLCRKSAHKIHLLRLSSRTFFDVLRTKLKWGER